MHSILIIFKKEMKDMLRDRRTIMAMVVLPLVLLPIVFTVIAKFSFSPDEADKNAFKNIRMAVFSNGNGEILIDRFQRRKDLKILEGISPYEFKELVLADSIDFGLIIDENFDQQVAAGQTGKVEIFHNSPSRGDTLLYGRLVKTIRNYHNDLISERLNLLGSNTSLLNPTKINSKNVSPPKNSIGSFAGGILPIFFVLLCFMGSMYPAIDLFVGEKERGTIETLLALPTKRLQILIGKLLTIVTIGVLSGSLTFVGVFLFIQLNTELSFINYILSLNAVFWLSLMIIPLATFFAGILTPISIYSKSIKEARRFIQPIIILIVILLITSMFSSLELNIKTAFIPVLNIALASKAIVAGSIDFTQLALVCLSLFALAAIGILLSRKWFENENITFSV